MPSSSWGGFCVWFPASGPSFLTGPGDPSSHKLLLPGSSSLPPLLGNSKQTKRITGSSFLSPSARSYDRLISVLESLFQQRVWEPLVQQKLTVETERPCCLSAVHWAAGGVG